MEKHMMAEFQRAIDMAQEVITAIDHMERRLENIRMTLINIEISVAKVYDPASLEEEKAVLSVIAKYIEKELIGLKATCKGLLCKLGDGIKERERMLNEEVKKAKRTTPSYRDKGEGWHNQEDRDVLKDK